MPGTGFTHPHLSAKTPLAAVAYQPRTEGTLHAPLKVTWLGQMGTLNLYHIPDYPFSPFLSGTHRDRVYGPGLGKKKYLSLYLDFKVS